MTPQAPRPGSKKVPLHLSKSYPRRNSESQLTVTGMGSAKWRWEAILTRRVRGCNSCSGKCAGGQEYKLCESKHDGSVFERFVVNKKKGSLYCRLRDEELWTESLYTVFTALRLYRLSAFISIRIIDNIRLEYTGS